MSLSLVSSTSATAEQQRPQPLRPPLPRFSIVVLPPGPEHVPRSAAAPTERRRSSTCALELPMRLSFDTVCLHAYARSVLGRFFQSHGGVPAALWALRRRFYDVASLPARAELLLDQVARELPPLQTFVADLARGGARSSHTFASLLDAVDERLRGVFNARFVGSVTAARLAEELMLALAASAGFAVMDLVSSSPRRRLLFHPSLSAASEANSEQERGGRPSLSVISEELSMLTPSHSRAFSISGVSQPVAEDAEPFYELESLRSDMMRDASALFIARRRMSSIAQRTENGELANGPKDQAREGEEEKLGESAEEAEDEAEAEDEDEGEGDEVGDDGEQPSLCFEDLLRNPLGMEILRSFMHAARSEEHLDAFLAAERFRSRPFAPSRAEMDAIYNQFVFPGSATCVGLSGAAARSVFDKITSAAPTRAAFCELRDAVVATMRLSVFPRLAQSSFHAACVGQIADRLAEMRRRTTRAAPPPRDAVHEAKAAGAAQRPATSLQDVLEDSMLRDALQRFCEEEHSAENVTFWIAVQGYRERALTGASRGVLV